MALWLEGAARYDLAKFDEAIDLFTKAYEVYPFAEVLFNLGLAHRQKKSYERAIFHFRSYLRNKPDATNRAEVERLIAELEQLAAADAAAAAARAAGGAGTRTETATGAVTDAVAAGGGERGPRALQPPGVGAAVAPAKEARAASPDRGPENGAPPRRGVAAWLLLGGGVALGVAAGLVQASARSLHDDARAERDVDRARDLQDDAGGRQAVALVLAGAGLAAAAAGIVKLLATPGAAAPQASGARPASTARSLRVRPAPTGVIVEGSF
jgi:tetratricopeptide (TPR) repeat protein